MQYCYGVVTRSCKNRFNLSSSYQDFDVSFKTLARIALSSQCFLYAENVSDSWNMLQKINLIIKKQSEKTIER